MKKAFVKLMIHPVFSESQNSTDKHLRNDSSRQRGSIHCVIKSKVQFGGLCGDISVDATSSVLKSSSIIYSSLKKHFFLFGISVLHSINRPFYPESQTNPRHCLWNLQVLM